MRRIILFVVLFLCISCTKSVDHFEEETATVQDEIEEVLLEEVTKERPLVSSQIEISAEDTQEITIGLYETPGAILSFGCDEGIDGNSGMDIDVQYPSIKFTNSKATFPFLFNMTRANEDTYPCTITYGEQEILIMITKRPSP